MGAHRTRQQSAYLVCKLAGTFRAGWKKVLNSRHNAHYGTSNILSGSDALQRSTRFNYFVPHRSGTSRLAWIRSKPCPQHAKLLHQDKATKELTSTMNI